MRLATLALIVLSVAAVSAQAADDDGVQARPGSAPLTFLCTGISERFDANGSGFNTADQFRLQIWKAPWRGAVEGRPISDLAVTDDTVTFTPPPVSGLHSLQRAYADVITLGLAAKSRLMRIDRQTGAYRSGYASGVCKLVDPNERLF